MPKEYVGELIERERKTQGLTREDLCRGICSPTTLYRIEKGQTPSQIVLTSLLQRLGLPDDLCRVTQSQQELDLEEQTKQLRSLSIQYCYASTEERPSFRIKVQEAIRELEAMTFPGDTVTRQYIEDARLDLGREDGTPYPPEERRERLLAILRMTQPSFDLEQINEFRYTVEETVLINQIAITYSEEQKRNKAIQIYRDLLSYMQVNNERMHSRYIDQFILVSANCARELNIEKRYEEAAGMAQQGRRLCDEYERYHSLPMILAILANCYAHMDRREEATLLYWRSWHLYHEVGDKANLSRLKKDAQDTLTLELP